jgi:hypothetical protein
MKRMLVMIAGSCLALAGVTGNAVAVTTNPAAVSAVYSFEEPDPALLDSFENEFQIRLPENASVDRFTWDSSGKNLITLTFSGYFDPETFFKEGILCKKGLLMSRTESEAGITEIYTIYGYTNYENDYAQMAVTRSGSDSRVQITMFKRGIRDDRLRRRALEHRISL